MPAGPTVFFYFAYISKFLSYQYIIIILSRL
jgi:hypothetical protein